MFAVFAVLSMLALYTGVGRAQPVVGISPAPPLDEPAQAQVHLVYSGGLSGIGSGDYLFSIVPELWRADQALDGHLAELAVTHAAAAQGPWTLVAADRSVGTLVTALQDADISCGSSEERPGVRTRTELLVMSQPGPSSLTDALVARGLAQDRVGWRSCSTAAGAGLVLLGPSDGLPASWKLDDWELRQALMGRWAEEEPSRRFIVATAPIQEASRLVAEARRLLQTQPGAVFVDAGSFLDGVSSARNDQLSLHRPLTWSMLESLAPVALVPGETELALGAVGFFKELQDHPLPYLASNWQAPEQLQLPAYRVVPVQTAAGSMRIAFVGVVDPVVQTWVPRLDEEGIELTDPVTAVQAVVDELVAQAQPPDAIVLLTTATGGVLADLRGGLRGVDLLLGDATAATFRVEQRHVQLRKLPPGEAGAPLTLSMDGLATASLSFDAAGWLAAVDAQPRLIGPDLPRDPVLSAAITRTRAQVYPSLDVALVPAADPDAPSLAWTDEGWSQLVCEAVRSATGADTVLLRDLPAPTRVPGPITELMAVEYLTMLDRVEAWRIPGDKLKTVLDRAYGAVPVSCGAAPGANSPTAWGRGIESARTYRLVTTDRTRVATPLGDILADVPATGPLDPPGEQVLSGVHGQPWTLRAAALQSLRRIRSDQADPDQAVADFIDGAADAKPGQWLFRLRSLSVAASRFVGADQAAFASVPETLATSPSSFNLTSVGDAAVEHDDPMVDWDLRLRSSYASQSAADSERQETADDWRASTSVELPGLSASALLTWSPYSELLYDSEFTRTVDDSGLMNLRQADLSLALGFSAGSTGPLSGLRLGAFASRDLAQLADKPTEWGGKVELDTSVGVGFLAWTTDSEGSLYADTAADDDSDLRFKVLAETKLSAPLARWLSVGLSAQAFLMQGRVPATQVIDGSWTVGATLEAAGAFAL